MSAETSDRAHHAGAVRRPLDLLSALAAGCVVLLFTTAIHALPAGSEEATNDIDDAMRDVPHWLSLGVSFAALGAGLVLALLVLNSLLRREARGAINAAVASVAACGISLSTAVLWNLEHGTLNEVVLHGANPSSFVIDCTFIAYVTASDLVRRPRWTRWCVICACALLIGDVAARALAPLAVPIALFGGLFFGWFVRWALGTRAIRPSPEAIIDCLRPTGIEIVSLREIAASHGTRLSGELSDRTPIEVRLATRDTRGAGLVRAVWSTIRLRPVVAGHPTLASRSRLERIALSSFLAGGEGVLAPVVLALSEIEGETLVLVTSKPEGRALKKEEAPEDIAHLFAALRRLHRAGVAHRDLRAENLVLQKDDAGFSSLEAALPGAGELLRRLDVTQLLTTAGRSSGADIAVKAFREAYGPTDEAAIAAILQPIALAPWGWSEMRAARGCVAEVRRELMGADDVALPETPLERFRWRTVLSFGGLTVAAFILVGQLSKVNLAGALAHTNYGWCTVALLGSALTYLAAAENLAAFVPRRLSILRGFLVQLSTAFVGVTMPPTVGHVAVNSRYLHRQGVDESSIAAAVALSQIVNVLTTVLLLLVIGLLTGSGVSRFKIVPSVTLFIALGALAGLVGLLLLVPRTRGLITRNVWPHLRSVWPRLLQALSSPLRLALGCGSNLLLSASYILAFVAAIVSVGGHPALLPVAAVYLAGNAVGSAAPTPGGVGAVEAVLSAGLGAIGVPVHEAIPAVLIFRVATFWLPIPVGWACFEFLQHREIL